jgi:hypothetical protein
MVTLPETEFGPLLAQHREFLVQSAIAPDVAMARGYRSITDKAELERLGFSPAQQLVPGLLIPIRGHRGEVATYQLRPDLPRLLNGIALEYEALTGDRLLLDIPPMVRGWLRDWGSALPLFITDGVCNADAAITKDMCCIAVLGVWDSQDSGTALTDFDLHVLSRRNIHVLFDRRRPPSAYTTLVRLRAYVESGTWFRWR